nr:beta-ribofuranosylaminobenzene 5'-phosphate synthase [Candidatus Sigynarchaeota archaeon]
MKVQIKTPSRIHVTLIDMNGSLGRIDGGVGFSLSNPNWIITLETRSHDGLDLVVPDGVDRSLIMSLVGNILARLGLQTDPPVRIEIKAHIPQHVGLGSKTQLAVALVDGLCQLFRAQERHFDRTEYARIVNRGGTSGIGINAYFTGGFIVDGGHVYGPGKEKESFSPSSASSASLGPLLFRHDFPKDWFVVCALPSVDKGAHDQSEVNIFHKYCPVPVNEVQELCHVILMKLLPAIKTRCFGDVCWCINKIQGIGFKKVELGIRSPSFLHLMGSWKDAGAPCVGMSSFGPCLYALAENEDQARELQNTMESMVQRTSGTVFITKACNQGANVEIS